MSDHVPVTLAAVSTPSLNLDPSTWYFLIFAAVSLIEIFLSYIWYPDYFRYGLPIFYKKVRTKPARAWPSVGELENEINNRFVHSMVFRQIGRHEYGFREKAFELTLFQSTPVMHGLLKWEPRDGSIRVIGYANWFIVFFSIFAFSYFYGTQQAFLLGIIAALLVLLYAVQARRFKGVADSARRIWSRR